MRVLLWATTLQADILALAHHLDARADCQLMVVTENMKAYLDSPIAKFLPLRAPVLTSKDRNFKKNVVDFNAQVTVTDNHFPEFATSANLCSMWHGLGWKARGLADLKTFYKHVKRLTGKDPREKNGNFLAQCYAAPDRDWRISSWKLHPDSCRIIGMAYSDLLLSPPYTRKDLAPYYSIDVANKKTILMSFTWHYGRIYADKSENDFLALRLWIEKVLEHDANVLLSLHDRKRYPAAYLNELHKTIELFGSSRVMVKHRDDNSDNLADLVVADGMISNLSSFITYFYLFGKPTIHILPIDPAQKKVELARLRLGFLGKRTLKSNEDLWMNSPHDNGGFLVRTETEVADALVTALQDPDCCRDNATRFLQTHVVEPNGRTCDRFYTTLQDYFC